MFHIAYVAYKYMVCFCMKKYVVFACVCPMNLCGFVYMYGTNVVLFTCVDDPSEDKLLIYWVTIFKQSFRIE